MNAEPIPSSVCASCGTVSDACEKACPECGLETHPEPFSVPHGQGSLSLSEPETVRRYGAFRDTVRSLRDAGYRVLERTEEAFDLSVLPYACLPKVDSLQRFRALHEHLTGKKTVTYLRLGRKALSSGFFSGGCHFQYDAGIRKTTFKPEGGVVILKYRPSEARKT